MKTLLKETKQHYVINNLPSAMETDAKRLLRYQEGIAQEISDTDTGAASAFMFESVPNNLKLNVVVSTNMPEDIMCMMNNLFGAKLI